MAISKFAKDILLSLLDGDSDGERAKKQIDFLLEIEMKYTGSGVFIFFQHNKDIEQFKTDKENLVLNGVI